MLVKFIKEVVLVLLGRLLGVILNFFYFLTLASSIILWRNIVDSAMILLI